MDRLQSVTLRSSNSDAALVLSEVEGDYFRVAVASRDHSASRKVYAYMSVDGLPKLFAEAARDWRGWEGRKLWQSLEEELRLELSTDRLGHVTLLVSVRSDPGLTDRWSLDARLTLDAGQLARIAEDVARLWPRSSS